MCNLYSLTKGQSAFRDLFRAKHDRAGKLPPFSVVSQIENKTDLTNTRAGLWPAVMRISLGEAAGRVYRLRDDGAKRAGLSRWPLDYRPDEAKAAEIFLRPIRASAIETLRLSGNPHQLKRVRSASVRLGGLRAAASAKGRG
jgi:hypothetical protein